MIIDNVWRISIKALTHLPFSLFRIIGIVIQFRVLILIKEEYIIPIIADGLSEM